MCKNACNYHKGMQTIYKTDQVHVFKRLLASIRRIFAIVGRRKYPL